MSRIELENKIRCVREDLLTLDMLGMIEKEASKRPNAFFKHSFSDIEANMLQRFAWLFCWLRAVYQHTVAEYANIHKFDHKVGILCVLPKPRTEAGRKEWLAYLNAQVQDQIGSDVELVFKKK